VDLALLLTEILLHDMGELICNHRGLLCKKTLFSYHPFTCETRDYLRSCPIL